MDDDYNTQNQARPLVSIVTPVYNGAAFLEDLIISVRDQDYALTEHIIIDDGSNDDGAVVTVLKKYPHVRWWSRPNQGQYATMNEGLSAAKGEIICFVSADDIMCPRAISRAVNFLQAHPQYAGVYGRHQHVDSNEKKLWHQPLIQQAPAYVYRYYPSLIAHCSLYVRRDALIHNNLFFNPQLRFVGDYDWILRINNAGLKLGSIHHLMALIRWHDEQASNRHAKAIAAETGEILKKHHVHAFAFRLINAANDRILVLKNLLMAVLLGNVLREFPAMLKWLRERNR